MLDQAISLLDKLIATPSVSRSEHDTATLIQQWLNQQGVDSKRVHNNVYAVAPGYRADRPTLMLNSHHDTVKPSPAYTLDPFTPLHRDGRIYGLGSNDAGASLVSLAAVFCSLRHQPLPFNLILAFSAEEEVTGENGMRALLPAILDAGYHVDMALVGEPTSMQPALAERGLIVLDCVSHGITGHAARNEGVNALYKALDDINVLRSLQLPRVSPTLGPVKITVTQIEAGRQHNVVPETCRFVVDVRTTDAYTNEETHRLIADAIDADCTARSYRIRASVISPDHPLVVAAKDLGKAPFVSPTTSDMSVMPDFPTLKMGPGESSRSHTADEYICVSEIADAIDTYTKLLCNLKV